MAKKDRNSKGRKSRRGKPGIASASVQAAPALLATPTPPVLSRRHKWLVRMALMALLPGLLLSALGQFDDARKHFVQARDWDAMQFRTDSRINDILREIASGKPALAQAQV